MDETMSVDPRFLHQIRNPLLRTDAVYGAIREMIVSGRARPGQPLRQLTLAKALEVDQRTVREALTRLVSEGLLEREPYKGVRPVLLPINELLDVYAMRARLEPLAMEAAAERISSQDLSLMRAFLTSAGNSERADSGAAHREFHWTAIRASQRPQVIRVLGVLWDVIDTHVWLQSPVIDDHRLALQENLVLHTHLVEALEARDSARAASVCAEHVERSLATLPSQLRTTLDSQFRRPLSDNNRPGPPTYDRQSHLQARSTRVSAGPE